MPRFVANWRDFAACAGKPLDVFVPAGDEPPYPSPKALESCNACPVRTECLDDAQAHGDKGVRGGLSTYQRRLLKRRTVRASCPACASRQVPVVGPVQVCGGCGTSWTQAKKAAETAQS